MGPAGLFNLLLWTHTFLLTIATSAGSSQVEYSAQESRRDVVRQKRQYSTDEMIEEILVRMNDVEDNVTRTDSAVENISEYLAALGFHLNLNERNVQRSQNPCEKYSQDDLQRQNEMPWTLLGNSKCVKLIRGLSTYANATRRCRQQYTKGQDIIHPGIVSLDSSNNVSSSLLKLLHHRLEVTSVWVDRTVASPSASGVLNCTELKVTKGNWSVEDVEMRSVECVRLNSVVCEKPLPRSFVEVVEGQLETQQRLEELQTANRLHKEEVEVLRSNWRSEVVQLEETSALQVKSLETKLEELRVSVEEERRLRTEESEELRRLLGTLEETSRRREVAAAENVSAMKERLDRIDQKAVAMEAATKTQVKSAVESLRVELTGKMAQLNAESAVEVARLRGEVRQMEETSRNRSEVAKMNGVAMKETLEEVRGKAVATQEEVERLLGESRLLRAEVTQLGNLRALVEEEKRLRAEKAEEAAALRRRLGDLEGRLTRVESAAKALESWKGKTGGQLGWTLGPTGFDVSQAMGSWRWIEVFQSGRRPSPDPCEEYNFNLKGSTVEETWRWGRSGDKREGNTTSTVDTQSPHQWIQKGGFTFTWVTTDYANWAVLMRCANKELSSCWRLFILSRERTLPPATLEMLRNVAEQRGFPKAHGALVDQTSC